MSSPWVHCCSHPRALDWPAAGCSWRHQRSSGPPPACGLRELTRHCSRQLRSPMQKDQPAADKKFVLAFGLTALAWFVAMVTGACTCRTYRSHCKPSGLRWPRLDRLHHGCSAKTRSRRRGQVQSARDHHVVSTGPYAFVRHQMYSGITLFFLGVPLCWVRGGAWRLPCCSSCCFAIRTRIENAHVAIDERYGYADYAARVRYRLVPKLVKEDRRCLTARLTPAAAIAARCGLSAPPTLASMVTACNCSIRTKKACISASCRRRKLSSAPARRLRRIPVQQARHLHEVLRRLRRRVFARGNKPDR